MTLIFKKSTAQPNFDVAATISGTLEATQELTCSWTVVRARDRNVTCRWYRHTADDGSGPAGVQIATGTTYTLTGTDVGNYIRAIVTAINPAGMVQSTTAYTAVITSGDPPTPPTIATAAAITGTADVGETLTVTYDFNNESSVAIQWYSYATEPTGSPLAGTDEVELGTASTQALTESEAGRWIVAVVTANNATGIPTVTSASVAMAGVDPYEPIAPEQFSVPAYDDSAMVKVYAFAGDDLQAKLNSVQPGQCLVLQAGATWQGRYTIPAKTNPGNEWIYVITSDMAGLPAEGTRVVCGREATRLGVSDDSAHMPKIRFYNVTGASSDDEWFVDWSASYWRFVGIEFSVEVPGTAVTYSCTQISGSNIVYDRCYLHGNPESAEKHRDGFLINSGSTSVNKPVAIINCHISDFKGEGVESHGVHVFDTIGPVLIQNNYVSACGINVFLGDNRELSQTPPVRTVRNVSIIGNHIHKPLEWSPYHASYNGLNYLQKNLMEFKAAENVLVRGNKIENGWAGSQSGAWLTMITYGGALKDIEVRDNYIVRACDLNIACTMSSRPVLRIKVHNNLHQSVDSSSKTTGIGLNNASLNCLQYLTIAHNTFAPATSTWFTNLVRWLQLPSAGGNDSNYIQFKDNIMRSGSGGTFTNNGPPYPAGRDSFETYCADDYSVTHNVFIAGESAVTLNTGTVIGYAGEYANIYRPSGNSLVGFTNTALSDFSHYVLQPTSAYYAAGSDGEDIGCNITALVAQLNDPF